MFDILPASIYPKPVKGQRIVLKKKVRHRAKLITDIVGEEFPEIALVIDQAIDLRNYYVHRAELSNLSKREALRLMK
jgi:hypothetical protein